MEDKALIFVELAAGIVLGFMVYTFIAPMIAGVNATPTA